jgi:4-amino-4-deoxy-L-arabinose transferase-like glycosyltransferase
VSSRVQFALLVMAAALLLLGPIRKGDLAGYDDAVYAHMARGVLESGSWLRIESNGYPALEHPPGLVWMQAALFHLAGLSDFAAKLPSALCGVGVVLLAWWLARRLLNDAGAALLAMLVMLATPYFVKYSAHAMTDVPFTFFYAAAVSAWVAARDRPRWYWAMAVAAAGAMLLRGVVGFAVPATLALLWGLERRPWKWSPLVALATLPVAAWYAWLIWLHGDFFFEVQRAFLRSAIEAETAGTWRRYTGAVEYLWMLARSYWPWLPFLGIGVWTARRDRRLWPLLVWAGVVYAACSAGGGRILRFLLPAYPAFSILAAAGLIRVVPDRAWRTGLKWAAPLAAAAALGIAVFPPVTMHAAGIRPVAAAVAGLTQRGERFGFYDQGQPRFDETGQLQWYSGRTMWILTDAELFAKALSEPWTRVWVVDRATYQKHFAARRDAMVVAESGHLVVVRLLG